MKKYRFMAALLFVVLLFSACGSQSVDVPEIFDNDLSIPSGSEKPLDPSVDPADPPADPEDPTVDPEDPTVDPEDPTVDPEDPTVDPEDPTVDPEDPTVDPEDPTVDPVEPPEPVDPPEPAYPKRVTFLGAGDNILHEAVFTDAMQQANILASTGSYGGKYYFGYMYEAVAELIASADIAFVNQETPVAGDDFGVYGYPLFNGPEEIGNALIEAGFDVVNLANNHMLDMDRKGTGLYNTIRYWNDKDILQIGGYLNAADYENIRVMEKNGIRIAFLSYTDVMNGGYTPNAAKPDVVIPYADKTVMARQVAAARALSDVVIVSMHWGEENTNSVTSSQKSYAKYLSELGVDVVLGHHSHTIQPVEWIDGKDGHRTLCYYSLGNFLSTQHPIKNLVGIFASFTIVLNKDGSVRIEEAKAIPHLTWYSTDRDNLKIMLLSEVTEADIKSHGSQLRTAQNGGNFTLSDVHAIVKKALDESFL